MAKGRRAKAERAAAGSHVTERRVRISRCAATGDDGAVRNSSHLSSGGGLRWSARKAGLRRGGGSPLGGADSATVPAPLPPFGPSGEGWPLGRRVHGPELEAAALQVEGVEFLENMLVAGWDGSQWMPGSVELNKWEAPELTEIAVVEGPAPPAGSRIEPPEPEGPAVPVPVLRDQC